jgi:hypothetical protein
LGSSGSVRGEEGNLLVYSEVADTMRKNTDARVRGGAARSSVEAVVMTVERRGSVIPLTKVANLLCGDE